MSAWVMQQYFRAPGLRPYSGRSGMYYRWWFYSIVKSASRNNQIRERVATWLRAPSPLNQDYPAGRY